MREGLIDLLPFGVLEIDPIGRVVFANLAAEQALGLGRARLIGRNVVGLFAENTAMRGFLARATTSAGPLVDYDVALSGRLEGRFDLHAVPGEKGALLLAFQARPMADRLRAPLSQREATRTVSALAAMLAHEVKNPLSGIRGAAQLLEADLAEARRPLARLIRDEVDRIVRLVNGFEMFSSTPKPPEGAVNINEVIDHTFRLAKAGFAAGIAFDLRLDPSLPPVQGERDPLAQVLINLVKNAAEALETHPYTADPLDTAEPLGLEAAKPPSAQHPGAQPPGAPFAGRITLTSAFRPGMALRSHDGGARAALPIEVQVIDTGPGIPERLIAHLFEPFVSSKARGSGLGLALVAKVVADHGGAIEHERIGGETIFRLRLPMARQAR